MKLIDLKKLDRVHLKGILMMVVFANLEKHIPSQNYVDFDFRLFYEEKFNYLNKE